MTGKAPASVGWYATDLRPHLEHALRLLAGAAGVRLLRGGPGAPGDAAHIHYGAACQDRRACVSIPARATDRLWRELLDGSTAALHHAAALPFDIVSATDAFIRDLENLTPARDALDRHGRLNLPGSFHGRAGYGTAPVVNHYADVLGRALDAAGAGERLARWPNGKRYAIGLSHDVDRPDKYAVLRAVARGGPATWLRRPELLPRFAHDAVLWLADRRRDEYWLFDKVVAAEAARGFRSTLMFAAVPAQSAAGARFDVHYDIRWPAFRQLFADLREQDIEVGLHASYGAHVSAERLHGERQRVERLAGTPVRGLRHHFWQVGPDPARTLRHHEAAGFAYDSSLAFNDRPGLRRAVALPYRPWDESLARPLDVLQLPVLAMDSALFNDGQSAHQAADELWVAVQRIRSLGGIGVLDWHVRGSYPANRRYAEWARCYIETLDRLAGDSEAWVTDLGTIEQWWRARERMLG